MRGTLTGEFISQKVEPKLVESYENLSNQAFSINVESSLIKSNRAGIESKAIKKKRVL